MGLKWNVSEPVCAVPATKNFLSIHIIDHFYKINIKFNMFSKQTSVSHISTASDI